jgi:hypothetical protein
VNLKNSVFAILLGLLVFEAVSFLFVGRLNRDEGWYLYASRLVYEGEVPYRDFAFFQMPLSPYLYGLPPALGGLLGPGVLVGRFTSLAFSAVSVGVGLYLARRLGGAAAVAVLLLITMLNPSLMAAYTSARAEAPSIAFLMLALLLLWMPPRSHFLRLTGAPLALAAATLCRLSFLPAFILATVYTWATTPASARRRFQAAALLATPVVATLLLAWLVGFDRFWFNVWTSQVTRDTQFDPQAQPLGDALTRTLSLVDFSLSTHLLVLAPAVFLGGWLAARWLEGWRPHWPAVHASPEGRLALILALGLAVFLPFLSLRTFEPRYLAPTAAILAVGVAVALGRGLGEGTEPLRRLLAGGFVILLVVALPLVANRYPTYVDARRPDLHGVRQLASQLRDTAPDGTRLATFDTTLAVESGLPLVGGLEMAQFSYWPNFGNEKATRLRVVNASLLEAALKGEDYPLVAAFTDFDLYLLAVSAPGSHSEASALISLASAGGPFELAEMRDHWSQFDDRLHILRPASRRP